MNLEYERIYKVRKAGVRTDSIQNLIARHQNMARKTAELEHLQYTNLLTQLLGHSNYEVTNVVCMADGIASHVYASPDGKVVQPGQGLRACVFCGCDDFDGY